MRFFLREREVEWIKSREIRTDLSEVGKRKSAMTCNNSDKDTELYNVTETKAERNYKKTALSHYVKYCEIIFIKK